MVHFVFRAFFKKYAGFESALTYAMCKINFNSFANLN